MVPSKTKELPPRARRIPGTASVRIGVDGTTSACAENTNFHLIDILSTRNYLRVRGEYASWGKKRRPRMELPPRARRIRIWLRNSCANLGTTSACAENTLIDLAKRFELWELPPRARRILLLFSLHALHAGTTSACAENTTIFWLTRGINRNYLRVRGEYTSVALGTPAE